MIFLELFWTFFKIGAFTFGGGYAMLPLIQDAVLEKGWMELSSIVNFIAVSESTPGPFAINMATYIGSEMGGVYGVFGSIFGSACATLGVVAPSFIIILIVAKCFDKFKESKVVKGCMSGLKPAVVGLIGSAIISVLMTVFFPSGVTVSVFKDLSFYTSLAIFGISVVMAFKKVHPIIIICLSAACGIAVGYLL
ncbi:MAG: chromate transporter [Ruminococcaceae bacterium]|nr:chromate transporter [Oscillospiraceae bacterium]